MRTNNLIDDIQIILNNIDVKTTPNINVSIKDNIVDYRIILLIANDIAKILSTGILKHSYSDFNNNVHAIKIPLSEIECISYIYDQSLKKDGFVRMHKKRESKMSSTIFKPYYLEENAKTVGNISSTYSNKLLVDSKFYANS